MPTKQKKQTQYQQLLQHILDHGIRTESQQEVDALTVIAPPSLRFDVQKEFPLITERKMSEKIYSQAIGEILGFINGLEWTPKCESSCFWWKSWVTEAKCHKRGLETGDMGPGSYGAAFHDFPTSEGEPFNQVAAVIQQIKEKPHLRTHFITPWVPQYTFRITGIQQKVVVCPCHGWMHIRILNNKLHLHMFQRSCDVPVGLPANLAQYAALTLMFAQVTGYEPGEYIHSFSDAHIFVDQVEIVKTMLEREARPLPQARLKVKRVNIFNFRASDVEIENYDPHPGIWNIPVAI